MGMTKALWFFLIVGSFFNLLVSRYSWRSMSLNHRILSTPNKVHSSCGRSRGAKNTLASAVFKALGLSMTWILEQVPSLIMIDILGSTLMWETCWYVNQGLFLPCLSLLTSFSTVSQAWVKILEFWFWTILTLFIYSRSKKSSYYVGKLSGSFSVLLDFSVASHEWLIGEYWGYIFNPHGPFGFQRPHQQSSDEAVSTPFQKHSLALFPKEIECNRPRAWPKSQHANCKAKWRWTRLWVYGKVVDMGVCVNQSRWTACNEWWYAQKVGVFPY